MSRVAASCLLFAWTLSGYAQDTGGKKFQKLYATIEQAYLDYDYQTILDNEQPIVEAVANRTDTSSANLLSYLAEGYYYEGDLSKAIHYYERDLALRQASSGYFPEYEIVIDNLATIQMEAGNYSKAIELYKESLPLIQKQFGKRSPEYLDSNLNLAEIYGLTSDWQAAHKIYRELKKNFEEEPEMYPIVLSNEALVHFRQGHYTLARELFDEALDRLESVGSEASLDYIVTLNSLGILYQAQGKYPEAEAVQTRALNILDRLGVYDSPEYAAILNNLAPTWVALGRYQDAANILQDLAESDKELYGEDHPVYSITLGNLASVYVAMDRFDQAEKFYDQALEIVENTYGEQSSDYAILLKQKAILYRKQKRYEEALDLFSRTVDIQRDILGEAHDEYAKAVYNLANMYLTMEQPEKARPWLEESLDIRKTILGPNHPDYAQSLRKEAILSWRTGDYQKANQLFSQTFENYFYQINTYFPALSEAEKAKFYNTQLKVTFEEFNSYAAVRTRENPEMAGQIYNYQLATKGLIMYATNKVRNSILGSGDSSLIARYDQWVDSKEELSQLYSLTVEELEARGQDIEFLQNRSNQLERELSLASSVFADIYQPKQVTWQDVRQQLKPGEAAIEIIRFRRFKPDSAGIFDNDIYYGALIVTPETQENPRLVLLINGDQMEQRFLANYRNAIKFKLEEDYSFQRYWEPIARYLPGVNKVYLSPDGVYNQISIASLRNPYTNKYLIDELEVQMVSNTKDLLAFNTDSQGDPGKARFFGYPNYNKGLEDHVEESDTLDGPNRETSREGLSRGLRGSLRALMRDGESIEMLPGTRTEIRNIARVYAEKKIEFDTLLHDDAGEEALKASQNPSTLHIATHGFFIEDLPPAIGEDDPGYIENPMLRSGLILAGANRLVTSLPVAEDREDGILTAYEAMNLDLDATELVVLSACETGLGQVQNGEGVYGLQRAFLVAGAQSIIMSLWSVDDEATQKLMNYFYQGWVTTGQKLQAFRNAQQKLKEEYPEPYYWGAFVMVGN